MKERNSANQKEEKAKNKQKKSCDGREGKGEEKKKGERRR